MTQQEYVGFGATEHLGFILDKHDPEAIFLVTGRNSYVNSGAQKAIKSYLENYNTFHFYDFEVNPKIDDIQKGIQIFREQGCDLIIAIGGGSVLDIAKSINILATNNTWTPEEYIKGKKPIKNKGSILVAIPTTAGSGSEATKFAVVYIDKIKYSLDQKQMLPDYTIIDHKFTMDLPKSITASTGMDALCQAIESYWSVNSTKESKNYSEEAIELIINNLPQAVNTPSKESRENMLKAANFAGKAINISRTTACHAISYPMTSHFNIPHGHAVSLTLGKMLVFNSNVTKQDILDKRGVNHVRATIHNICNLFDASNTKELETKLTELMTKIGLETNLSKLNMKKKDIRIILDNVNLQRLSNNPRTLIESMLKSLFR